MRGKWWPLTRILAARHLGLCARRWQVILVSGGGDDFRGCVVVPLRESYIVCIFVFHLFFERGSIAPVNFGVGSGSTAVLEFWRRDIICATQGATNKK